MNGWVAAIMSMWPVWEIARSPTATSKTSQVLVLEARGADDRVLLGDVGVDLVDLRLRVAHRVQRHRHRLVDDRHLPAADQLLELDQREVGLDPGRVAVHQEADRPGRGQHRRLRVAVAVLLAELDRLVPGALGGGQQVALDPGRVDLVGGVAVHPHDPVVRLAVLLVGVVGPGRPAGDQRRLAVGAAGHQRRDRGGDVAAGVGVVGEAVGHQQGAEVGVAEAELAEGVGVGGDLLGRVGGEADDDLLGEEDDVDRVLEGLDVEAAVLAAEFHQVERGQVAGRVVDVHVLAAGVGGVDPARLRAGVPAVDRGVVLDARIGAAPGGVGDLVHQVAGVQRFHRFAGRCGRSGASPRRRRRPP